MKKDKIGEVTAEECEKIKSIYMRKTALEELLLSMERTGDKGGVYDKIIADIVECNSNMNKWWTETSAKYGWGYDNKNRWEVQFNTKEVFLYTTGNEQ